MWTKTNIPDQTGKTIIVTGANTGIGYETALALYEAGAHVVLACRSMDKARNAQNKLEALNGKGTLEISKLNLSDLDEVREFADKFLQRHTQLDVLINNASVANTGANVPDRPKTADGYEEQFGINFLGHFALTGCLYPLLKATPGARVVTVSSNGYQGAHIDFDNLRSENSYDAMRQYRQSKLANLMMNVVKFKRKDALLIFYLTIKDDQHILKPTVITSNNGHLSLISYAIETGGKVMELVASYLEIRAPFEKKRPEIIIDTKIEQIDEEDLRKLFGS